MHRIAAIIIAIAFTACTTYPNKIQPAYKSPQPYQAFNCDQLHEESVRINANLTPMGEKLEASARGNALSVLVGLFLFWPSVTVPLFMNEKQLEPQYANLLGELTAVKQTSESKQCVTAIDLPVAKNTSQNKTAEMKKLLEEKQRATAEAHKLTAQSAASAITTK